MTDTSRVDLDIIDIARKIEPEFTGRFKTIARAIQAERDRCEKLALRFGAEIVAAAIREGDA